MAQLKERGLPAVSCGIFYSCLCVFSLVVGMYYIFSNSELDRIELSENALRHMIEVIPFSISIFFGLLTFMVGIVQGAAAACLLKGKKWANWRFSLGFSIFSLLSCLSKLLMSVNPFSITKSIIYTLVIIAHFLPITRKNYFTRDDLNSFSCHQS